jgi:hypothetical protein
MTMGLLNKPAEKGRPWYKRLTIMSGAATAVLSALEPFGVVPPGSSMAANAGLAAIVTAFGTLLGLYRQVAAD